MKRTLRNFTIACCLVGLTAATACAQQMKNAIIMIADGWGYNQVEATNRWNGVSAQTYEHFPVRLGMSTFSWNTLQEEPAGYDATAAWASFGYMMLRATDSASAATAMSTGVKNWDGEINVDPITSAPLFTVTERAEQLGKSTGVITSVPLSHATPAGFSAHDIYRGNYSAIAVEMLDSTGLEVIMGAGHPMYNDNGALRATPDYRFVGGQTKWNQLVNGTTPLGWTLIESKEAFQSLASGPAPERVCGVAQVATTLQQARTPGEGANVMTPPYTVPLNTNVPTLAEMTRGALNVLDNNPLGFFLMIEGGAIDWANHANQGGRLIEEMNDFNAAVEAVIAWVEANSNWNETILIVTGDHECGYLWGPNSGNPATWNPVVNNGAHVMPGMQFYSGSHTNSLIPLYAKGVGAAWLDEWAVNLDPVRGRYVDNTNLALVLFGYYDNQLAVELGSFQSVSQFEAVELRWTTLSESNVDHFEIIRGESVVGLVNAFNSAAGHSYEWTDRNVEIGVNYSYRLVSVDRNGERETLAAVNGSPLVESSVVAELALAQNYPNPFNPLTQIAYQIPASGHVTLKVFNMVGQEVATLVEGLQTAGDYQVSFNGTNLPSALYIYRIEVDGVSIQKKMLLVK